MSIGYSQTGSAKNSSKNHQRQKVGNPIRIGNHNHQYIKDSNGNLRCVSRPIIQKINPN